MREIVRQHKISLLAGCVLIPFLLAVPLVLSRSADGNYTGVINTPGETGLFLLCCLPPFLYLLAVTAGVVSGLSEWVYLTVTSISLTVLQAVLPAERKSS